MKYCSKCVYPSASAVKLTFDDNGVCSGCRVHKEAKNLKIDWNKRAEMLKKLVSQYKSKEGSNYDCVIPVSGGKDSYFQTHYVTKVLGLKPLLITYHGNNYLPVGEENLNRMREVFDVDHLIFKPGVDLLKKINRLGFKKMGDMNWHNHCGIFTYPMKVAVFYNIPLIIWGEHGFMDLGGMHSLNDFVEFTAKYRFEHNLRGYDWYDMIDEEEGISKKDLLWAVYPSNEDIERVGLRGIFLANFMPWDGNRQAKEMIEKYGFKISEEPFDRTYRRISNLDDMHENGIHDYLKFIKFGYGRATDHSCKDIRGGYMTREQGIEMVKKYDHIKSRDLKRWLEYVSMTEKEFDEISDRFRDPRVWWISGGNWWKDNVWGEPSSYGTVHLSEENQKKYLRT